MGKKYTCALFCVVVMLFFVSLHSVGAQSLTPNQQLGKSIFFDMNLSINMNQSCAACHGPDVGWTGPIEAINEGGAVYEGSISGRFGDRKPPSSGYATFSPIFHYNEKAELFVGGNFWDGRATGEKLGESIVFPCSKDKSTAAFTNFL